MSLFTGHLSINFNKMVNKVSPPELKQGAKVGECDIEINKISTAVKGGKNDHFVKPFMSQVILLIGRAGAGKSRIIELLTGLKGLSCEGGATNTQKFHFYELEKPQHKL